MLLKVMQIILSKLDSLLQAYVPFDVEFNKSKIIKMIVCINLPFSFTKINGLHSMHNFLILIIFQPFEISVKVFLLKITMNSKLFESHWGFVSFTVDEWTSCQCLGYFGIVVHFIDDKLDFANVYY